LRLYLSPPVTRNKQYVRRGKKSIWQLVALVSRIADEVLDAPFRGTQFLRPLEQLLTNLLQQNPRDVALQKADYSIMANSKLGYISSLPRKPDAIFVSAPT
jgi:hypothetical protein